MRADAVGAPSGNSGVLRRRVGLVVGVGLFVLLLAVAPAGGAGGAMWRVVALLALMGTWWATEAVPLAATALLPIPLLPILGVLSVDEAAAPFADPLIFLFLGGFLLAAAITRWNLHVRVALRVLAFTGTRPRAILGGVMLVSALLSMWVSNTATAVVMMPIAASVAALIHDGKEERGAGAAGFGAALALGVAFGTTIGGLGTLVGTPPNALFAAFMREAYGIDVSFARWMLLGVPLVAILLPAAWFLLSRLTPGVPEGEVLGAQGLVEAERARMGPLSRAERRVAVVFAATAFLWVSRPLVEAAVPGLALPDAGIGILGALALFLLPAGEGRGPLLDWEHASRIPWSVLILFGGGLSLAEAMTRTGLADVVGSALAELAGAEVLVLLVGFSVVVVLLSEFASNTASAAAVLPVVAAAATASGASPLFLAAPVAVAASGGFMLPVATPPNAVAYGTGLVSIPAMIRAGVLLDVAFVLAAAGAAFTLVPLVFPP